MKTKNDRRKHSSNVCAKAFKYILHAAAVVRMTYLICAEYAYESFELFPVDCTFFGRPKPFFFAFASNSFMLLSQMTENEGMAEKMAIIICKKYFARTQQPCLANLQTAMLKKS